MSDLIRVGFLQCEPQYLSVDANLEHARTMLSGIDADLVVLPELFTSGYHFRSADDMHSVAERVHDGPTVCALAEVARTTGCAVVVGLPEVYNGSYYNSSVLISPDGQVSTYRKVHLFYREKELFTPGNLGFPVFDLNARAGIPYRLGMMICFDWYFPEAARSLALAGADVIAHPSNLVRKDCPRSMPIRALENHVFTVTANRTGAETAYGETLTFIGQSLICDPAGEVLACAERTGASLQVVEIDVASARRRNITSRNDLFEDRRPEQYRL